MPPLGWKHDETSRMKMRDAKLSNPTRYWLGKTRGSMPQQWRDNIGDANRGKPKPEDFGEHLRQQKLGVPRTPAACRSIKAAANRPEVIAKARAVPSDKRRRSPEHYARLARDNRGKPACYPKHRFYYKDCAFRSSWELRLAVVLDALGIAWEYEKHRFDLGGQTWAPDFYLPVGECFWEVKGWKNKKWLRTQMLFRDRFPAETLIVIDGQALKALERRFDTAVVAEEHLAALERVGFVKAHGESVTKEN